MPNHIHPPVAKLWNWTWGCGNFVGHDPGCAPLPPEAACLEILNGKNKGNYLCRHPRALAAAVEALEDSDSPS